MRDAATPPDDGHDAHPGTTPTPQQRAAAIRAAAAEVMARVEECRNSPGWRDDDTNGRRYQLTVEGVAALDKLPDPETHEAISALVDAIRPILSAWRPSRPGPEQAIFASVESLQRAVR
jgi:hypothetical protein